MAAVITRADEPGAVPRTVFFGLLNDVASDPQVTDLAVTCDGRVWADRGNGMRETVLRVPFRSPQVVTPSNCARSLGADWMMPAR